VKNYTKYLFLAAALFACSPTLQAVNKREFLDLINKMEKIYIYFLLHKDHDEVHTKTVNFYLQSMNFFEMKTQKEMSARLIRLFLQKDAHNQVYCERFFNHAAKEGYLEIVKFICENKILLDEIDDADTELQLAIENGNLEMVKYLCENMKNKIFDIEFLLEWLSKDVNQEIIDYVKKEFNLDKDKKE
jgi:hypothetical protein